MFTVSAALLNWEPVEVCWAQQCSTGFVLLKLNSKDLFLWRPDLTTDYLSCRERTLCTGSTGDQFRLQSSRTGHTGRSLCCKTTYKNYKENISSSSSITCGSPPTSSPAAHPWLVSHCPVQCDCVSNWLLCLDSLPVSDFSKLYLSPSDGFSVLGILSIPQHRSAAISLV